MVMRAASLLTAITSLVTTPVTVATLPTGTVGSRSFVTDALTPVHLSVVVGGGLIKVPVFHNGTTWIVG